MRQDYQTREIKRTLHAGLDVPRSLFAPGRIHKAIRIQKAVRDCQAPEKICGDAKRRPETQILKATRLRTLPQEAQPRLVCVPASLERN